MNLCKHLNNIYSQFEGRVEFSLVLNCLKLCRAIFTLDQDHEGAGKCDQLVLIKKAIWYKSLLKILTFNQVSFDLTDLND